MIPSWMTIRDVFIDIHEKLRPFDEVREILETIEKTWDLKKYFNGYNLGGRWIFQVFSSEFVNEVAGILNKIVDKTGREGPVLEVMSGDGVLSKFLAPMLNREIVPTDAKSDRYRIAFPKEVETISAMEAVNKYDPAVVLMSWEPFLSMDAIDIVRRGIPLVWIGEAESCGHPDLFLVYCQENGHIPCRRVESKYAIGRHDSILKQDYRTAIYVFNCRSKEESTAGP